MSAYLSSAHADLIGFAGMFCIVAAFAYSNMTKEMHLLWFNIVNLLGAILLTISLTVNFNLPTMVLEIIWMGIASFGIVKELMGRKKRRDEALL